jgi:hypothetical protein
MNDNTIIKKLDDIQIQIELCRAKNANDLYHIYAPRLLKMLEKPISWLDWKNKERNEDESIFYC